MIASTQKASKIDKCESKAKNKNNPLENLYILHGCFEKKG